MGTRSRSAALVLLCAADLLVMLDGMVVTVALPAIERDLGTAHADLQWVLTAYTVSLGSFLLIGGRAGDLYGRRRALVAGLSVFALASLAAGLAPSTAALLAARAVQGFGAALAIPAALALLTAAYRQGRERDRAVGLLSAVLDGGMVAGLILGGVLTASLGWPWCFVIVVPLGLAAAALAPAVLDESRDEDAPALDVPGALLCAAGCGALLFGLARLERDVGDLRVLLPAFLVAGFGFASAYVPLTSQGVTGVREGEKGLASGLFQTSTHLGGALVLAILATAAAARTEAAREAGAVDASALTSGFTVAFLIAAGILLLGAVCAVRTLPAREARVIPSA